jgi:hypothetical protein
MAEINTSPVASLKASGGRKHKSSNFAKILITFTKLRRFFPNGKNHDP